MSDVLSRLSPPEGARHKERRLGRGPGSTQGKGSGRGYKGQKKRSGGNINKLHFQGGQTPIQRRLPKRGFRIPFPTAVVEVNVSQLQRFRAGTKVTEEVLREARLINNNAGARIKILGNGTLDKKLTVSAHAFSKGAVEKIEAAGGSVVVIGAETTES